jgi:predicted Rossmann fold nucleotide-binding protein DprA/Smf involved in DNA uptake
MATSPHPHQTITPQSPDYPHPLKTCKTFKTTPTLTAIGNLDLLKQPTIALLCSVQCPGDLILKTYDLAQSLRDAGISVISGFHSPIEHDCLTILLRGTQPVIHCYARSIHKIRLTPAQTQAIAQNRLLLLSPFSATYTRTAAKLAVKRNQVVGTIADATFLAYAAASSKTYSFAKYLMQSQRSLVTFQHAQTQNLIDVGAIAIGSQPAEAIQ